jgi:hypothetical protein
MECVVTSVVEKRLGTLRSPAFDGRLGACRSGEPAFVFDTLRFTGLIGSVPAGAATEPCNWFTTRDLTPRAAGGNRR